MTSPDPESPQPTTVRDVEYKGAPLDSEKGPGLGCFYSQLIVLGVLIVLTPLTVFWRWPYPVSAALLFAILILLFISGQTMIFLLRLVAADRRADARRRPLAPRTPTVGQIEDATAATAATAPAPPATPDEPASDDGVRE